MDKQKDQRIKILIDLLNRGKTVNSTTQLAAYKVRDINVDLRTAKRDVDFLRTTYKAPIVWDPSERSLRLDSKEWQAPLSSLDADLVGEILRQNRVAGMVMPEGFREFPAQQLETSFLQDPVDPALRERLQDFVIAANHDALDRDNCISVFDAWQERKLLEIDYIDVLNQGTSRVIEAHALYGHEGSWYIVAWCRTRQAVRSFALHRIRKARKLPTLFQANPEIRKQLEKGHPFAWDYEEQVRLRLNPASAAKIGQRQILPGEERHQLPDGGLELHWQRAGQRQLLAFILSCPGDVEALAPASLRQLVVDKLRAAAELHGFKLCP